MKRLKNFYQNKAILCILFFTIFAVNEIAAQILPQPYSIPVNTDYKIANSSTVNPNPIANYSRSGPTLIIASHEQDAINYSNSKNIQFSIFNGASGVNNNQNSYCFAIVNKTNTVPINRVC